MASQKILSYGNDDSSIARHRPHERRYILPLLLEEGPGDSEPEEPSADGWRSGQDNNSEYETPSDHSRRHYRRDHDTEHKRQFDHSRRPHKRDHDTEYKKFSYYSRESSTASKSYESQEPSEINSDLLQPPISPINPTKSPLDSILHISLDVQDDIERHLEELSRLRRLGHFKLALNGLAENITPFLSNRYVLVQYARLLMDGKCFAELSRLAKDYPPKDSNSILEINWMGILTEADYEADFDYGIVRGFQTLFTSAQNSLTLRHHEFNSTELEVLLLTWHPRTARTNEYVPSWHRIYRHLRRQKRLWEISDLLRTILLQGDVVGHVLDRLCGSTGSRDETRNPPYLRLLKDFNEGFNDESSAFALLDTFTSICLAYTAAPNNRESIEDCLEIARQYASRVLSFNIENLKTRPYLRFLMAEVLSKKYNNTDLDHTEIIFRGQKRGEILYYPKLFPDISMPIYAPIQDEAPEWRPQLDQKARGSTDTIRVILKAAEELGDFGLQAGCLFELVTHGAEDLKAIVNRLKLLLLERGAHEECRHLMLFRYMLAQSPMEREELRRDILVQGEYLAMFSHLKHTRCMILAALTDKETEKYYYRGHAGRIRDLQIKFHGS